MIIDYLKVEVVYTKRCKIQQSMKLNEWARNEFEKNRGELNEANGIRQR